MTQIAKIKFPNVVNMNLLRVVKDMILYQNDKQYKAEQERKASEATAGNVTYAETLNENYVRAGRESGVEHIAIENIMRLSPEYFVAQQLITFGKDELLFYLTGLSLCANDKNKIINAYDDIKRGNLDKVKFLQKIS